MKSRFIRSIVVGVLALAMVLGCVSDDDEQSNGDLGWLGETSVLRNADKGVSHPGGIGGWYMEDGTIRVYTDDPREDPAEAFAEMYFGEPPNLPMPIMAVESRFPLNELREWARQVNEANKGYVTLSSEGIRSDRGRIMYGVLALEDVKPAIAFIEWVGVPRAAFEVRIDHLKPDG